MNTLLEVKHKLKTQDLFRATTVRALVDECERLSVENAKLRDILNQSRWVITSLVDLEASDGGRTFPSKGLIEQARQIEARLEGVK